MTLPYRTRRFLQGLGIAGLILAMIAVVVWLIWLLWLDRFVVYSRDGAKFDFSLSSQELTGVVAVKPTVGEDIEILLGSGKKEESTIITELVQLKGYYADVSMLEKEFDLVLQQVANVKENTPVMLDVKDIYGYFLYSSTVGAYRSKTVDTARMDELIDYLVGKGAYLIARLPAFKDQRYGLDHVPYGLAHSSGRYLYMDEDRCYWLDPTHLGTLNYLKEIVQELKEMGFDEVVLSHFTFPDTNTLAFKGDRSEAITKAAAKMAEACATESFAVSFVGDKPTFPLPEGRTRLYLANRSATDAAELAKQTNLEDVQIKLVFIADGNDTRFDAYGVLRPITAARFEDEEE